MIGKLVFDTHITFMFGRQILDRVVVGNELIELACRENMSCMIFKFDFENEFDFVS